MIMSLGRRYKTTDVRIREILYVYIRKLVKHHQAFVTVQDAVHLKLL